MKKTMKGGLMKKTTAICACLLLGLVGLTSCGEGASPSQPEESPAQTAADSTSSGQLLQYAVPGLWACGSEGTYVLQQFYSGAMNLLYLDYASQQEIFVCSRPECSHSDESCTSYIPFTGDYDHPLIACMNDTLYLLQSASTETTVPYLEQCSKDGSQRERLFELDASQSVASNLYGDSDSLYFTVRTIRSDGTAETQLMRYAFATQNLEPLYTFGAENYLFTGVYGSQIAVTRFPAPGEKEEYKTYLITPQRDIASELQKEPCFTTNNVSKRGEVGNQVISYSDFEAGTVTWYAYPDTEANTIQIDSSQFDGNVNGYFLSPQAGDVWQLVVSTIERDIIYNFDLDTGACRPFTLTRTSDYTSGPIVIVGEVGDDLLVYTGETQITSNAQLLGDRLAGGQALLSTYALISKENYRSSKPDYRAFSF